ncbi:MAG TPA: hypothetical protein VJ399_02005 [Patescibacteria group bacterium]|nr:hypothetical protein [Patescibacteria group bacterium]
MQKEVEIVIKGLIGDNKPFQWVREKLELLSSFKEAEIFKDARWELDVINHVGNTKDIDVICQKELGNQAIGVILSFTDGNLVYSEVFLDLSDKFIYVRKARNKKEVYFEVRSGKINYVGKSPKIS